MRTLILATSVFLGGVAAAHVPMGDRPPNGEITSDNSDQTFIAKAGSANLAEIKMGQLAVDRGSTPDVRKLAQRLVDDHERVGDELRRTLAREGVEPVPAALTAEQQAQLDRLSSLSGQKFDDAYLETMKKDHEQAISLFSKEASHGKDPRMQSFAQTTLPSLHKHSHLVDKTQERVERNQHRM